MHIQYNMLCYSIVDIQVISEKSYGKLSDKQPMFYVYILISLFLYYSTSQRVLYTIKLIYCDSTVYSTLQTLYRLHALYMKHLL